MVVAQPLASETLRFVEAPMVNQSDLPFRLLTTTHGATCTYTQMYVAATLLSSQDALEAVLRTLHFDRAAPERNGAPTVVQLGGNDPRQMLEAARKVQGWCDAVDVNLGCPQRHAREGGYGAYLLGKRDWPRVEDIVSTLAHNLDVPVHAKLRLCTPPELTPLLARRLALAGSSVVALHARFPSATRRRRGAAELGRVREVKEAMQVDGLGEGTRVLSNGNVRAWEDVVRNAEDTGADGVMVGEALLDDPSLFSRSLHHGRSPPPRPPSATDHSLSYLRQCEKYPACASLSTVKAHVVHFFEHEMSKGAELARLVKRVEKCEAEEDVAEVVRELRRAGRRLQDGGWEEEENEEERDVRAGDG